jgi:hypothetical protein
MTVSKDLPVIAGVEVPVDSEGRYNLNTLHRAHEALEGSEQPHKRPSEWLKTKGAQDFVTAVKDQNADSISGTKSVVYDVLRIVNGGNAPGTFAHELIAVEYAGWISPAFRIKVNQAFIDYRTGKLVNPVQTLPPYQHAAVIVPDFVKAAKAFGFTGNQATLSANRAVLRFTGINLLEAMGQAALASPDNQPLLTSTDLALRLGIGKREANPLLIDCGFQTAHRDHKNRLYYELTEEGTKYGVLLDTDKHHGSGTPVRQIKWSAAVLPTLEARLQVESEQLTSAA